MTPVRTRRLAADQRGMTLVETMLAVMLSSLMMLPMMGWASLALKEQANSRDRNISSTSLGLLRTYFVRDVANADWVAVDGAALTECSSAASGAVTLMTVGTGERRVAYSLEPVDGFTTMLQRLTCAEPGGEVVEIVELAGDVIRGGTSASCRTDDDLAAATAALDPDAVATAKGATAAAESDPCRRVTLQLTTSTLAQIALTATVRSGITSAEPPVAVATATPTSGPRRLRVAFTGTDSTDPGDEALTYAWDFGDGATSDQSSPTHDYSAVGPHTATLTVTNESGLSSATTIEITVTDNMPVAVIAAPAPASTVFRGQPVAFSSDGSNDLADQEFGGRIVGYVWDFGDGTTSTDANPTKAYTAISPPEGYPVRLAVFDDAGQTATAELKVLVANRVPTVTIVASATSGTTPLTVDFSANVVDETTMSPNPALTYAWNFGDGATSTLADPPARTYTGAGNRTVTLTVTDDQGATASATQTITVNASLLPAPTGLKKKTSGTSGSKRYIDLQFNSVSGASQYEVMVTCVSSGCTDVFSNTGSSSPIRINGLQKKTLSYDAQVRTKNSTGQWGPWSAKVRVSA